MKVTILITISFMLLILSCKKEQKENNFNFEGIITDTDDGSKISNAKITLSKREVSSGTFNSSYTNIDSEITNSNGLYNFSTTYGSIESFKFTLQQDNYFGKELIVNPDNLSTENTNELNFSLQSKGNININLVNATPFDEDDKILFSSLNPDCANCVKFTSIQLNGIAIDTNLIGVIEANKFFKYQYFVTKNGVNTSFVDSVFCTIGGTASKVIQY